jgi:hypothetical protein
MERIILLDHFLQKIRGWLLNQKRNILMNLRSRETAIQENTKLKEENAVLHKKLFDLLFKIDEKINTVSDTIQRIQDQKPAVISERINEDPKKNSESLIDSVPLFIPTLDSYSLKGNVQEPKKKIRNSNIADSIDKLSKLQDNQ